MSEDSKPAEGAVPPRLKLDTPPATVDQGAVPSGSDAALKKETRRVEVPPVTQAQDPASSLKKKTSRIPLEHVSAETNAAQGTPTAGKGLSSKTIRLSPALPTPPSLSIPTSIPPARSTVGANMTEQAKRQTSRIPLETVLSGTSAGEMTASGTSPSPKTIRIKRPEASQSVKLGPSPEPVSQPPQPVDLSAAKRSTSRLELVEEPQPESQNTQRKTIKIRRAEGPGSINKPAPRSVNVARLEAKAAEYQAEQAAAEVIHVIYPVAAAVAFLILCATLYVLVLQVLPGAA